MLISKAITKQGNIGATFITAGPAKEVNSKIITRFLVEDVIVVKYLIIFTGRFKGLIERKIRTIMLGFTKSREELIRINKKGFFLLWYA